MIEKGNVRYSDIDSVEVELYNDWEVRIRLYKDGKVVRELFYIAAISSDTGIIAEDFKEYQEIMRDFYDLDVQKCKKCGKIFVRRDENEILCPDCRVRQIQVLESVSGVLEELKPEKVKEFNKAIKRR